MLLRSDESLSALSRAYRFGARSVVMVWDSATAPKTKELMPLADGEPIRPPVAKIRVPMPSGEIRNLLAVNVASPGFSSPGFPSPGFPRRIELARVQKAAGDGGPTTTRGFELAAFDPFSIFAGADTGAKVRIARFLLDSVPGLLRSARDPGMAAAALAVLRELGARPRPFAVRCRLFERWLLVELTVPTKLGSRPDAVVIGARSLSRPLFAPILSPDPAGRSGQSRLALLIESAPDDPPAAIVVFGAGGLACRIAGASLADLPDPCQWLTAVGPVSPAARWALFAGLARLPVEPGQVAALRHELIALSPPPMAPAIDAKAPVAAAATLMVGSAAGVFVRGWFRDRHRLIEGLVLERISGRQQMVEDSFATFTEGEVFADAAGQDAKTGFVAHFPHRDGDVAEDPCRLLLTLKSGRTIALAEGPMPLPTDEARAQALAAVPERALDERVVGRCLAPLLRSLVVGPAIGRAPVATIDFGTPPTVPVASIVLPLSDDPAILRCRTAIFAADSDLAKVEIVYVLADGDRRCDARDQLAGLHAVYGLPMRLLVIENSNGGAVTLNAGAGVARASSLVFLGVGVVPENPGWLRRLLDGLVRLRDDNGVVGGRILHDDGSIRSAGADLATDRLGAWGLHHRLRGFPSGFEAARKARPVAAVSAACMAMSRALFVRSEGFDPAFLGPDAGDADLCARIWAAGGEVWAVAQPAMIDLSAAPSVASATESPAARALDRLLLEERWRGRIEHLVPEEKPDTDAIAKRFRLVQEPARPRARTSNSGRAA